MNGTVTGMSGEYLGWIFVLKTFVCKSYLQNNNQYTEDFYFKMWSAVVRPQVLSGSKVRSYWYVKFIIILTFAEFVALILWLPVRFTNKGYARETNPWLQCCKSSSSSQYFSTHFYDDANMHDDDAEETQCLHGQPDEDPGVPALEDPVEEGGAPDLAQQTDEEV